MSPSSSDHRVSWTPSERELERTRARWGDGSPAPKPLLRAGDADPGDPIGAALA